MGKHNFAAVEFCCVAKLFRFRMWISFPQCATPLKMIQKYTLGYLSISTAIRAKRATLNVWSIKNVLLVLFIVFFSLRFVFYSRHWDARLLEILYYDEFSLTYTPTHSLDPFKVWEKFASYSSSSKSHHCHKRRENNQRSGDNSWEHCNKATIPSLEKNKTNGKKYHINCTCYIWIVRLERTRKTKHWNGLTPDQRRKKIPKMYVKKK